MNRQLNRTVAPVLILVMLFTWFGHLFTLSMTVHIAEHTAPSAMDTGHSHGEQSLHQTTGISHQHSPLTPDHLHDSLKLPDNGNDTGRLGADVLAVSGPFNLPIPPRFRIERPPRLLA